jgi:hypothetical protein
VGVRPEELPTYILTSRGSHQLKAVAVVLSATSDALNYDFIIVLVKVPLLHWEYSFKPLGLLIHFLVILA